jgi:murein DD-endopeptidase MepM/ murein hydrolase activator NlpD
VPQRLIHADNMPALYAIIAHESIHIKRYDVVWMTLQSLLQIVYFFLPVAWYANRQIGLARECICDRTVVSGGKISTAQYGSSLLMVLKFCFRKQEPLQFLPSFNAQYRNLKARIQRLKSQSRRKKPHSGVMYAVLVLFGLLALPMAPEMTRIKFFTPFQESERHMYDTLQQRLVTPYAEAYSPTLTSMRYTGIGLQGEFGETVYAIGKGEIVRITGEAPHTEVVIAHTLSRRSTVFSVYAHVDDVRVQVGELVTENTPIASLLTREEYDKSGLTEQHLHLEVRQTLDAYRSRSPHYLKYQSPEILESGFVNPLVFYRKHLQS